jgi:hypothetical protein
MERIKQEKGFIRFEKSISWKVPEYQSSGTTVDHFTDSAQL